jgi:RimJ/RimL family protein N-acetyltransferase
MPPIVLRPLAESDLPLLRAWFRDREARRRLGGMLPLRAWYDHAQATGGYFAWMAYEDERPVALVVLETGPARSATFALLVASRLRGRGYGKRIVRALRTRPEVKALHTLECAVEPDNTAALRCLRACGFAKRSLEPDDEGLLTVFCRPGGGP